MAIPAARATVHADPDICTPAALPSMAETMDVSTVTVTVDVDVLRAEGVRDLDDVAPLVMQNTMLVLHVAGDVTVTAGRGGHGAQDGCTVTVTAPLGPQHPWSCWLWWCPGDARQSRPQAPSLCIPS